MTNKKRQIMIGAIGAASVLLVILILLAGKIGFIPLGMEHVFQKAGVCNNCHETWYNEASYAFNPDGNEKLPDGVAVGCAECHPVQYEEYLLSAMGSSKTTLRPGCVNCHDELHSVARWFKHMYLADDGWKDVQRGLRDREFYNNVLTPRLAEKAREHFMETKSQRCVECHTRSDHLDELKGTTGEFRPNIPPHIRMEEEGLTCIQCHQNLMHNLSVPAPSYGKPTRAEMGQFEAGKEKAETCGGCHGEDGNTEMPMFPSLAGLNSNYFYMQIKSFMSGARKNDMMEGMVMDMSDGDIADLAAYYGQQKLRPAVTRPKVMSLQQRADLEKGESLYLGNCARCHGQTGRGQGVIPAVIGQPPEYTLAQIEAFKSEQRSNHSIMRDIVKDISDDELSLMANYLGGLY
jgi:cytochrome c553